MATWSGTMGKLIKRIKRKALVRCLLAMLFTKGSSKTIKPTDGAGRFTTETGTSRGSFKMGFSMVLENMSTEMAKLTRDSG